MKKITTFLILISFLQIKAQSYQKMIADSLTTFYVANVTPGVVHPGPGNNSTQGGNCLYVNSDFWYFKTDSVYKTVSYKKVSYAYSPFLGLIREDTAAKKVYFIPYCDTNEVLLYDFSLTVGSTINYSFISGSAMPSGVYKVDSIKLMHDYKTYYHRHFYLKNHASASNPVLEIVEGVGQVNHPLFLYYSFQFGELSWGPSSSSCPQKATFRNRVKCASTCTRAKFRARALSAGSGACRAHR